MFKSRSFGGKRAREGGIQAHLRSKRKRSCSVNEYELVGGTSSVISGHNSCGPPAAPAWPSSPQYTGFAWSGYYRALVRGPCLIERQINNQIAPARIMMLVGRCKVKQPRTRGWAVESSRLGYPGAPKQGLGPRPP
jgi:hypothetical protein